MAKSSVSEVLAGKKPFSRQRIRKLADYFKVDVSIVREIPVATRGRAVDSS